MYLYIWIYYIIIIIPIESQYLQNWSKVISLSIYIGVVYYYDFNQILETTKLINRYINSYILSRFQTVSNSYEIYQTVEFVYLW